MLKSSRQKSETFRTICEFIYQKVLFTIEKVLSKWYSRYLECISNTPAETFCQKSKIFLTEDPKKNENNFEEIFFLLHFPLDN